jgi:hypothetical protein
MKSYILVNLDRHDNLIDSYRGVYSKEKFDEKYYIQDYFSIINDRWIEQIKNISLLSKVLKDKEFEIYYCDERLDYIPVVGMPNGSNVFCLIIVELEYVDLILFDLQKN